ncbi:hypothetical protein [Dyadobacter sp. Leaf189]|uniref:hypothetical protein n=1 Tax=Dyadobacter sp. Leaf189 TaxID=1736295 RepID=UPI0012F92D11|nr:hypothetical protein [Dyadobacter sp. Leaf189]
MPRLICTCIIFSYFFLIILHAVNIPRGDDLYCLLLFTQSFRDAKSWTQCFQLLFEQWVEHRIIYSRLTALASYWLHGTLNFKTIMIIGNASLLGITFLIYRLLQRIGLSISYLLPVVLTLFSPVMYEGNLWAGAATVYMPVCFTGMLSIYLLTVPSRIAFVSAVFAAILATYSFGNGMFTFLAGCAVLLYLKKTLTACLWMLVGLAAALIYFGGFKTHSATSAFDWAVHFRYPAYIFYNFSAFVGGIFNYYENVNGPVALQNTPAILCGVAISVFIAWSLFKIATTRSHDERGMFAVKATWIGFVIFIGITSVVIAYSRTSAPQMTVVSSRYKIYSMTAFLLVYLWCLISFKKQRTIGIIFATTSAILLVFNYFVYYEKFVNYKSHSLAGLFNYTNRGQWIIYNGSYFEGASKLICDSIRNNPKPVFHFQPVFHELSREALSKAPALLDVRVIENKHSSNRFISSISVGTNAFPTTPNMSQGVYLVMYNEEDIVLFAANPLKNGRFNMLRQRNYFKPGFYLEEDIHRAMRKGKVYKLAVFCPTEKEKLRLINHQITGI